MNPNSRIVTLKPLAVSVPLLVPAMLCTSSVPPVVVVVGLVQPPQVRPEAATGPLAVTVELPLVRVPLTVPSVHVMSASPAVFFSSAVVPLVRLKFTVVFGHGLVHGVVVVLQIGIADV